MSQNFSRLKIENSSDFLCVVKVNILFVKMNDYEYTNEWMPENIFHNTSTRYFV